MSYNPWPLGRLPKELQRPEPEIIRSLGYNWEDPREIIGMFEKKVAEFAGCAYAVAVDCCTHAIELSFRYKLATGELTRNPISIPEHTYVSAYLTPKHLGFPVVLKPLEWEGGYFFRECLENFQQLNTGIYDGAVRWMRGMYQIGSLHCLSFQIKKRIPIGRGGMVLTDDKEAADWIRLAAYDGRDLNLPYDWPGHWKFPGFHYYMTPEDAARGIILMDQVKEEGNSGSWQNYPSLKTLMNL